MKKIGIESEGHIGKVVEEKKRMASLAFRVVPCPQGLYAHEMLLLADNEVVDRRIGVATTLGHAIAAADDLLDGWAFSQIEVKPEDFFAQVLI